MKFTIELDWDTIDNVATSSMKSAVVNLEADLKARKKGTGLAIFHKDKKKDIAETKRHIEAFRTVLKYYGEDKDCNPRK